MDIDCMYDDILDSIDDVIEAADIVLIGLSEGYRESPYCTLGKWNMLRVIVLQILIKRISFLWFKEAKYTLALKKPYIPMILQSKLEPSGWIDKLSCNKNVINFTEKSFDDCMQLLLNQIKNLSSKNIFLRNPGVFLGGTIIPYIFFILFYNLRSKQDIV